MPTPFEWLSDPSLGLVTETRPLQIELVSYLDGAVSSKKPCLIEAGTGIGKSFTYLLAAREAAMKGHRVVISTAMKSLQQQLYFKDLPYLESKMKMPAYARQLGKKNYGCKRKVALNVFNDHDEKIYDEFFSTVKHWVWDDAPQELADKLPKDHWRSSVSYCNKERCDFYEECAKSGYVAAKSLAESANLVVVNHALVGADIRVDAQHDVKILGNYEVLVVDEAHKFPEAIRNALACQMPANFFDKALQDFQGCVRALQQDMTSLMLPRSIDHIPRTLPNVPHLQQLYRAMFRETQRMDAYGPAAEDFARAARTHLNDLYVACGVGDPGYRLFLAGIDNHPTKPRPPQLFPDMRTCLSLMELLTFLDDYATTLNEYASAIDLAVSEKLRYVVTVVTNHKNVSELHTIPIDVGDRLQTFYGKREVTPHYLSATLAVNGRFDHYAAEVGHELVSGSTFFAGTPFDYKKQAWCYAPSHIPEPTHAGYLPAVVDECYDLLMANEGHAFILFTSFRDLDAVAEGLTAKGYPYPLLKQSPQLKARGREIFLSTPNATLLGTRTFWEGIDIPGLALTLVIIPKAPFPNPSDPVIKAKSAIAGDKWFFEVSMPATLIDLRQMAGRLIRSTRDRGVVAFLDSRIHSKRYGKQLVGAIGFPWNASKEVPLKLLAQLAARRNAQSQ